MLKNFMEDGTTQEFSLPDFHMMSNEEELELIEECKRKNPERYTLECLAKARKFAELPCNIPGLR